MFDAVGTPKSSAYNDQMSYRGTTMKINLNSKHPSFYQGFTLVEMAIVLVIMGVMLGGLVVSLQRKWTSEITLKRSKKSPQLKRAYSGLRIQFTIAMS